MTRTDRARSSGADPLGRALDAALDGVDAARSRRWRRALAGRDDTGPRTAPGSSTDVVVTVRGTWPERAARALAERSGRPVVTASRLSDVPAAVAGATSALVAAPPEALTWRAVHELGDGLAVPWGLLTAPDEPGLWFVVAKMVRDATAAHATRPAVATLDGGSGALRLGDRADASVPDDLVAELGTTGLDWMGILAHGEGGHLKIGDSVLCGLLGDVELDPDGRALLGCGRRDGRHTCKRSPDAVRPVVSPSDLPVRRLGLFSCTSSAVTHSTYPSRNSCVLAALDGWASAVLAVRDAAVIHPVEESLASRMLRDGMPSGRVRAELDDIQHRRSGRRPYLLFGDPCDVMAGPAGRTVVRDLGPLSTAAAIEPEGRDVVWLRGRTGAGVLCPDRDRPPVLRDRTADVAAARAVLRELSHRAAAAARTERAILRRVHGLLPADGELLSGVTALQAARVEWEHRVQGGLAALRRVTTDGRWDAEPGWWLDGCTDAVTAWDAAAAECFALRLLDGDVFGLLADALIVEHTEDAGWCEVCDAVLERDELVDQIDGVERRGALTCLNCAGREAWPSGGARVSVTELPECRAGTVATVDVTVAPGSTLPRLGSGQLVVRAFDKANRRIFFADRRAVLPAPAVPVTIPIPSTVGADLHYLWFVWVHGGQVSVLRRRWPCVRRIDENR